jgi:hypothetical protein
MFLVTMIHQRRIGRINKYVEFIGQLKEVSWGRAHSPLVPFILHYLPPFVSFLKANSDDGMDQFSKMGAPQWFWDQGEHLRGL